MRTYSYFVTTWPFLRVQFTKTTLIISEKTIDDVESGVHDRLYRFHAYAAMSDTIVILPTNAVATALRTIG